MDLVLVTLIVSTALAAFAGLAAGFGVDSRPDSIRSASLGLPGRHQLIRPRRAIGGSPPGPAGRPRPAPGGRSRPRRPGGRARPSARDRPRARRSRPARAESIDQAGGPGRGPQHAGRLRANRVVPVPAVAGEHRQPPALRLHEREERGRVASARSRPCRRRGATGSSGSQRRANSPGASTPTTTST